MPRQKHEIISTTINLFKNGTIVCKSISLAREVISLAERIITIFKRAGDIEAINHLNNLNIESKKGNKIDEVRDANTQVILKNAVNLCMRKLSFGNRLYIYDVIQQHIIEKAFLYKDINGGYVKQNKCLSNEHNAKHYRYIYPHLKLTLIGHNKDGGQ